MNEIKFLRILSLDSQYWNNEDKKKKKTKDEVKTELIGSFIEYENVDNQELNEKEKNIKKLDVVIPAVKEYKTITKLKKGNS